jgi:hypothetical protein
MWMAPRDGWSLAVMWACVATYDRRNSFVILPLIGSGEHFGT